MRQASLYSAALHIAVITVAYFGVPSLFRTPPVQDAPITVDIVSLEEIVKPRELPKPAKPVPRPPAKKPPPPPPAALPKPPEPPAPVAEPVPEPPPVLAKPEQPPKPKPKPKAKPKPPPAPKPTAQPASEVPKPKKKPVEPDSMQALLIDLAKRKQDLERQKRQQQSQPKETEKIETESRQRQSLSAITQQIQLQKLVAMVKQQVAPCWSIPAGVKDADTIEVGVRIRLNTDGTLRGAPRVVDVGRMDSDAAYRVVAESAVRALLNPRCRLKLPYDQYEMWKDITFNFDPGDALGQ